MKVWRIYGWAITLGKKGIKYFHKMILLVTVMTDSDNRKRSDGELGNNGSFSWLQCLHRQCGERARCTEEARALLSL